MRIAIYWSLIISILGMPACRKKDLTIDEALVYSEQWLWRQQSADGGWHSETHAVLRDGRVLTPYILYHLVAGKDNLYHETEQVKKAVGFITKEMRSALSEDSTSLTDYPNYSAAYALKVLQRLDEDTSLQHIIAKYLLDQQFLEHRGFTPDSLVYGGWGYGEPDLSNGKYGHVDISHTRRITEALIAGDYLDEKRKNAVRLFLSGVQRSQDDDRRYEGCESRDSIPYDGGFVSSIVTLATNKSQPVEIAGGGIHYPSYATATCDGFLCMEALGMQPSQSYGDAKKWLLEHQDLTTIDGLSKADPEQWADIMHYYHFAVRAEAMSIIEPYGNWKKQLINILVKEQQPDGYFINPIGGVNKEDDPLMATIFCVQAMKRLGEG